MTGRASYDNVKTIHTRKTNEKTDLVLNIMAFAYKCNTKN